MWFVFALLSAVFAALTSILAKIGIAGVNSNLATAIRTMVVLVMAWGMVFLTNTQGGIAAISKKSWLFLILSGLATGASWLCYYRALQIGDASKVVPIDKLSVVITLVLAFVFLHEKFTARSLLGCALIGAGTLLIKFSTDRGYATSLDMRVYLWRDEVEGNNPVMTVEYKTDEWNPDYDIINNPEEFRLYVDGELVEYE